MEGIWKKQFSGVPSRDLKWENMQNQQDKNVYSHVVPLIHVK